MLLLVRASSESPRYVKHIPLAESMEKMPRGFAAPTLGFVYEHALRLSAMHVLVRWMCSEPPAETFTFVVLMGRKATLCSPCSSHATLWGSLCSHHMHQPCSWCPTPTVPWRTAPTCFWAWRTTLSTEVPSREDSRIHVGRSQWKVAVREMHPLKSCPVFRGHGELWILQGPHQY